MDERHRTYYNAKWDVVSFRPDLIEFHKLTRSNATHNLQLAFNVAEHHLGLTKLLDPEGDTSFNQPKLETVIYIHFYFFLGYESSERCSSWCSSLNSFPFCADVNTENPDEKSIITYVVSYYHYFSKMKALIVEGKRVGKVKHTDTQKWMLKNRQNEFFFIIIIIN